jgi:hypothetical protein
MKYLKSEIFSEANGDGLFERISDKFTLCNYTIIHKIIFLLHDFHFVQQVTGARIFVDDEKRVTNI